MLAQTFNSHEELGISERLYQALVQVYWLLVDERIPEKLFDMDEVGHPEFDKKGNACGTAGCILGWCEALDKDCATPGGFIHDRFFGWGDFQPPLSQLFLPDHVRGAFGAKRKQAAVAIHGYLTTGKDGWKQAMKG